MSCFCGKGSVAEDKYHKRRDLSFDQLKANMASLDQKSHPLVYAVKRTYTNPGAYGFYLI